MKFVVFIKHLIAYDWNNFVSHVNFLIIIISQINVLKKNNHIKYAIN
jgi:hypothetical protein